MAIYKIFPSKDATIYSRYPSKNTGLDEILSISIEDSQDSGNPQVSRTLIQFSDSEISDVIVNKISGSIWSASLRIYASTINGLNSDTTLEIYPISGSWNMGTGKYAYNPEYTNGVNWYSKLSSGSGNWSLGTQTTPRWAWLHMFPHRYPQRAKLQGVHHAGVLVCGYKPRLCQALQPLWAPREMPRLHSRAFGIYQPLSGYEWG